MLLRTAARLPTAHRCGVVRLAPQPPEPGNTASHLAAPLTFCSVPQAFGGFGAIDSVRVMLDGAGQCKGWGFVRFMSAFEAHTAMEALSGVVVGSKTWIVTPKRETGAA